MQSFDEKFFDNLRRHDIIQAEVIEMEEETVEAVSEGIFSPAVSDTILIALIVLFVLMAVVVSYLLSKRTFDTQSIDHLNAEVQKLSKKIRTLELEAKVSAGPQKVDSLPGITPFDKSEEVEQEARP